MIDNNINEKELAEAMIKYLDCPCQYFPAMDSDKMVLEAYYKAQERGKKEGFVPMMVVVDDRLWGCLVMNADSEEEGEELLAFNAEHIAQYRKNMLNTALESGKEVLENYRKEYYSYDEEDEDSERDEEEWDAYFLSETELADEIPEDAEGGGFMAIGDSGKTVPLILAEIPVKNPWEVFAYLPFGGWNECPDTLDLMAVSKYWYEMYQAAPAAVTSDILEFIVPEPVEADKALDLAKEQYVFCTDIVDQGVETVGNLASMLSHMKTWFFWWD